MIKVKSFTKAYEDFLLSVPELELEEGKIYAVIGANGSGKTTFSRCLGGLTSTDDSSVLTNCPVGYLPQASFPFRMSVEKNISSAGGSEERTQRLIEQLELTPLLHKNAKKLSGGQLQRMCLARLLCKDFPLILLDEPTSALDMKFTLAAESAIKDYTAGGNTVVIVTHSISQAERIGDYIMFFKSGSLEEMGPASQLLHTPSCSSTREFLAFFGGSLK